jgi:hypothetical protein
MINEMRVLPVLRTVKWFKFASKQDQVLEVYYRLHRLLQEDHEQPMHCFFEKMAKEAKANEQHILCLFE